MQKTLVKGTVVLESK